MIIEQRRKKILEILVEKNIISIDELAKEFDVSRVTVQRDLKVLESEGFVSKIHNGAKLKPSDNLRIETKFEVRLKQFYEEKLEIAKKAISYVNDGDTIFLDSSSTIYIFALELFKKPFIDLNVITNSTGILFESFKHPNIKMISTGGILNIELNMLIGKWVIDFIEKINFEKAFISAAGLSNYKIITTSSQEIEDIVSTVCEKSIEINLLLDSSKFMKAGMFNISDIKDFKRIITNSNINEQVIFDLKNINGPEIIF